MIIKSRIFFTLILLLLLTPTDFEASEKDSFGICESPSGAFTGEVFEIPITERKIRNWIPDFSNLIPKGIIYTKYLNVPSLEFERGFPGVLGMFEWYAIRYTATFEVETGMKCVFRLNACSGANLYIDEKLIVYNDGRHAPKDAYGNVYLKKGAHKIRVDFYQTGPMDVSLQLFVTIPGEKEKIFNPGKILKKRERSSN